MTSRAYLAISGIVFFLVSIAHLFRVIQNWSLQVAQWTVPMEVSWLGFIVPFALAMWALKQLVGTKNVL